MSDPPLPAARATTRCATEPRRPASPGVLDGRASAWPGPVRDGLAERRRRLEAEAVADGARVLDLADPDARRFVLDAGRDPIRSVDAADRYDLVRSVAALVVVPDLPLVLRGVARVLEPGGRFRFVEPVSRPGWAGMLAASTGAALTPVRGQHLGRDLLAAIRATGLLITDLERFTMPTLVWPLRSFVDGVALSSPGWRGTGRSPERRGADSSPERRGAAT